jgi:hypothetical protein
MFAFPDIIDPDLCPSMTQDANFVLSKIAEYEKMKAREEPHASRKKDEKRREVKKREEKRREQKRRKERVEG